jgi:hypothetical protein
MRQPPARTTALRRTKVHSKPTDSVTLWVIEKRGTPGQKSARALSDLRAAAPKLRLWISI